MAAILLASAQAPCLALSSVRSAAVLTHHPRATLHRPAVRMVALERLADEEDCIDYDGTADWDEQLAEQEEFMAERYGRALEHDMCYDQGYDMGYDQGEWRRPPQHGIPPQPSWYERYGRESDDRECYGRRGCFNEGYGMSPPRIDVEIPEGCYEGMEFTIDFEGRPLDLVVPNGFGPGMVMDVLV